MKTNLTFVVAGLLAVNAQAGEPKDDVMAAAKKLAESSYAWTTTSAFPGAPAGGGAGGGNRAPVEGKIAADGFACVTLPGRETPTEAVMKGEKIAVKRDGAWMTLEELSQGGGDGRGRGMFGLRNLKAPAAAAVETLALVKELTATDDAFTGELTEEGAKALLSWRRRGGDAAGGGGPEISGAKGSVKFWLKEGVLAKMETSVQGSFSFNGETREMNRTTTTEIKEVGTATVTVPDEAKAKVEG